MGFLNQDEPSTYRLVREAAAFVAHFVFLYFFNHLLANSYGVYISMKALMVPRAGVTMTSQAHTAGLSAEGGREESPGAARPTWVSAACSDAPSPVSPPDLCTHLSPLCYGQPVPCPGRLFSTRSVRAPVLSQPLPENCTVCSH